MKRTLSIELFIITVLGIVYFALHAPPIPSADYSPPLLNLSPIASLLQDTAVRPIGIEHERLAGTILPIRNSLLRYGHIPMWNSYLSNGVPLANNAFSYLYNPFHSLPVLILGGVTGSKIATITALLIAGYSMWILGFAIGLGAVARVSIALLYMFNGGIAAKFGAGHFQLACSLAWPPLVLAALWWTLHTPKRIAPVIFGVSFALLFYAGNIYYVLHTIICCVVILVLHLLERNQGHWHIRTDHLKRILLAGVFAFGLSALQFFPVWQTRDFVTHDRQAINDDGTLASNYDIAQSINNLILPWQEWHQYSPSTLFEAVDYAYIGNIVFILILLALVAQVLQQRLFKIQTANNSKWRLIAAIFFLALFMMLWAGGQVPPLPWLYTNIPLLAQFRFIGRALAIAGLCWILLAGIALDSLWGMLRKFTNAYTTSKSLFRSRLLWMSFLAFCAWAFLLIYSASNGPNRIVMVTRNVTWWQQLDTIRYATLPEALHGLIVLLISVATLDTVILIGEKLVRAVLQKQKFPIAYLIAHSFQVALIGGVALGIHNVMTANLPAFQYSNEEIPFDTIYDDIRTVDPKPPFPIVGIPFSPFTFDAYEHEIRVASLNEGWMPAAPAKPVVDMGRLANPFHWLITKRNEDGSYTDTRSRLMVQLNGYQLRACYVTDTTIQLSNCSVRKAGFNLYELPQALPYAFVVSEAELVQNPEHLTADQVETAAVTLYQQDTIVIEAADTLTDSSQHYLVIQEANFPGWQASVEGKPVQLSTVPTNVIGDQTLGLIAIPIEKGNHIYTLRFDPPGLTTGIVVFFATLILIFVYLAYHPKQKSPT